MTRYLTYFWFGLSPVLVLLNTLLPWIHEYSISEYLSSSLNCFFGARLAAASTDLDHLMYSCTKLAFSKSFTLSFNSEKDLNFSPIVNVTSSEELLSISNTFDSPCLLPHAIHIFSRVILTYRVSQIIITWLYAVRIAWMLPVRARTNSHSIIINV